MLEFLPEQIKNGLRYVNQKFVYELRLRAEKPTTVNYAGVYKYLSPFGLTDKASEGIVCSFSDISDTVYAAGKFSVYSVEEQIKHGFITAEHGERIGLAGEYVYEKGEPLSIRKIYSLCIRVPHEVVGCGQTIYDLCLSDGLKNLLLLSPPGLGKTTLLRDLSRLISENTRNNILVCDERGELSAGDLGGTSDILTYADKLHAFEGGIRAMRPDVIITDELSARDILAVKKAIDGGVHTLASAHFDSMEHLDEPFKGVFDRYIFLRTDKLGVIKEIFNKAGEKMKIGEV